MRVAILASVRLFLLIPLMLSAGGAAQVPGAMLGNWHSASLDKVFPLIRQECVAMSVSERSVTLNSTPETKKLNGEWMKEVHLAWVTSDGGKCRWSETAKEFVPVMEATVVFPIDGGVYDASTGILKVHLQRGKCEGALCFQADEEALAPAEVELKSVSTRLVQVNRKINPEMDEIPELEFDRVGDELLPWMRPLLPWGIC